jgi:hypothetical protein
VGIISFQNQDSDITMQLDESIFQTAFGVNAGVANDLEISATLGFDIRGQLVLNSGIVSDIGNDIVGVPILIKHFADDSSSDTILFQNAGGTSSSPEIIATDSNLMTFACVAYDGVKYLVGGSASYTVTGTPAVDDIKTIFTISTSGGNLGVNDVGGVFASGSTPSILSQSPDTNSDIKILHDNSNGHIQVNGTGSVIIDDDTTVDGVLTVNDYINVDGTPGTDDTFTGQSTNSYNAGATVAQWEAVYLDSSSTWQLTDADAASTSGSVMVALATEAGTSSNPLRVALPGSFCRNDAWTWTVGAPVYLSTTPGALTQTAPSATDDVVRVVGFATNADTIFWNPSPDYITIV